MAIALRGQGDCRPIVDYLSAHVGDAAWREVSRLTVPYLGIIQQLDRVAGEVVEALIDRAARRAGGGRGAGRAGGVGCGGDGGAAVTVARP